LNARDIAFDVFDKLSLNKFGVFDAVVDH
jgi:hypothetical protein